MLFLDSTYYLFACFAALIIYALIGATVWEMVLSRIQRDVHGLVMIEQERQGQLAMLLPKATVVILWPLVAMLAILAALASGLRATAPTQ